MRVLKAIPNIYFDHHHSISGKYQRNFEIRIYFIVGESNFLNEFFEKKVLFREKYVILYSLSFFYNINLLSFCEIIQQEKEAVFVFQY